jgi:hypothetical protein
MVKTTNVISVIPHLNYELFNFCKDVTKQAKIALIRSHI